MTREAHLAKFRANWGAGAINLPVANSETLIERVDDIDVVADMREIVALMTP